MKQFLQSAILISSLVAGFQALAQEPNVTAMPVVENPKSSILKNIVLGMKSYNDTGRFGFQNKDLNKDAFNGRTYKGKHEAKLGYKTDSGWGAYAQMTQYRYDYKEASLASKWSASDPSISLTHPMLYNSSDLKIMGFARYYIPFTDRSKSLGVRQIAYYLDSVYQMEYGQEIFNELNPRVFIQNSYGPTDTRAKLEDITVYTKKLSSDWRVGFGQWTQIEQHAATANGATVDVYPMADYLITPKIFVGPRLYMPVYVENSVYDGSRQTSLESAYFELYFQASL